MSTVNNTGDPITLDGTENTVVETAAGVTGHATTQDIADLGGGVTTVVADDEDVTVPAAAGTTIVLYTALTAPRTVFLPASTAPEQMVVLVRDVNGVASGSNTIGLNADSIQAPTTIAAPNGELIVANDSATSWFQVAPNASFPIEFGDGTVNYEIDADGGQLYLQANVAASPGDIAQEYFQPTPDGSQWQVNVGNDAGTKQGRVTIGLAGAGNPTTFSVALDNTEYIDASDTIANGFVLRDAGGGLHLQGTIPTSDPHVDRQVYAVGYVQGVSPGTLMISAG